MAEWTPTAAQREAVHSVGSSVIVSAGAGSGKTAVLAERCAHLVADGRPTCPVDRLLVVTFTEAAAAEMRLRIGEALRGRLAARPTDGWVQRQIALLDAASISTIHSFCRRVLGRFFARADLEPEAPVLSGEDAELMRRESVERVFDRFAERRDATGEAFLDLVAAYAGPSEQALIDQVLAVDAFLASLARPEEWLDAAIGRFEAGETAGLSGRWLELLHRALRDELGQQIETVETQLTAMNGGTTQTTGLVACLQGYCDTLGIWDASLGRTADAKAIDEVCVTAIGKYKFPEIPKKTKAVKEAGPAALAAFEGTQKCVQWLRDSFKKRLKGAYGRHSCADWAEGIARTRRHVNTLARVLRQVRADYQSAKAEMGVVDFSDLERKTLELLADESTRAAAYFRDKYEHVLVDEFQDTSPIQAEILRLVSRESLGGRAWNLFAVGDVKQSIYRFRLAEPRLFLDRRARFRQDGDPQPAGTLPTSIGTTGRAIDLVENFRSRRGVIEGINQIFERLMASDLGGIDYDEHARLKAGRPDANEGPRPAVELRILDDIRGAGSDDDDEDDDAGDAFDWQRIEREAYAIGERIRALVAEGTKYADIVVLLRSMQPRAGLFVRTLARRGIPVFADTAGGLFESLEVLDVLSLLSLLDNGQQDIPLAAVLRSPLFGRAISDDELVEIRTMAGTRWPAVAFHEAVQRYAEKGANVELRERLRSILDRMRRWRSRAARRPLADTLWKIYEESGYLAYVCGLRDGEQRRANLLRLHEYAREFGAFTRQGLYRFLRFIDALREAKRDLEPGAVAAASADVVRVMTIHRSKGLEFSVVIVGEMGKRFNLGDARGSILFDRRLGLAMEAVDVGRRIRYTTLPHRLVSRANLEETLAEEMRVLYVALTRAKERLVLVGTAGLSRVEEARERWRGHAGPLPRIDRSGAQSMLDWVLAAVCCQERGRTVFNGETPTAETVFAVRTYAAEAMEGWKFEPAEVRDVTERLEDCAAMKTLPAVALGSESASDLAIVKRRLTTVYPAAALTRVPAVAAASELKRRWEATREFEEPTAVLGAVARGGGRAERVYQLKATRLLAGEEQIDAATRGTWTHEFLQRVDLRRPCDAADLKRQLREMIEAGVLESAAAKEIDLGGAAWFFGTPVAKRIAAPHARVLREWPFVLRVEPTRYDSAASPQGREDMMLVRGMVDCLFDDGAGWELVDYKTDDISGAALRERAEQYRGQLDIYATAVKETWRQPVSRRWLAFLAARETVAV